MANGARLVSAVMFVRNLERSVRFYAELLTLDIADRTPTAALLISQAGSQLILRAVGETAMHALGGAGIQYLVWAAGSAEDLARCEQVLKRHSAYTETRSGHGLTAVEGRDPDRVSVMVCYPGPDAAQLRELPVRIYAW